MMRFLLAMAWVVGCSSVDKNENIAPGGNIDPGGGENLRDGSVVPKDDANNLQRGQLCVVRDLRSPLECPEFSNLEGVRITIADQSVTANNKGEFEFALPDEETAIVMIIDEDGRFLSSISRVDLAIEFPDIPVMPIGTWNTLVNNLGANTSDITANLALIVRDADGPKSGAEVFAPEGSLSLPYYNTGGINSWANEGLTGTVGAALLFGVPVIGITTHIDIASEGDIYRIDNIPVAEDTLTFATVGIP